MHSNVLFLAALLLLPAGASSGQSCNDFDPCTTNDMCVDEECAGTPATSGSCDDGNDCTVNDRCTPLGCMGEAPPPDTECAGGCGICQPIAPVPNAPYICGPKPDVEGQPCEPLDGLENACLDATCQTIGGFTVLCLPSFRQCPDTDGNPCTDFCNPATGECSVQGSPCIPTCEVCNPQNGACQPANLGAACDDFDVCTTASSCQPLDGRGFCLAGTPSVASPTATAVASPTPSPLAPTATQTQPLPTATRTAPPPTATGAMPTVTTPAQTPTAGANTPTPGEPTATSTSGAAATPTTGGATCVGDCNGNAMVAINELIVGVNIALGNTAVAQCPAFDPNGNGAVAINELILGVNNALNGC